MGVNWVYLSRCAGKLIASEATALSEPGQQVGVNVINSVTSTNFNETSKCIVTGDYSAILNVGTTTSTNSAAEDKFNDFQSEFVAAGMTYNVTQTDSLELLGTLTGTSYNQRGEAHPVDSGCLSCLFRLPRWPAVAAAGQRRGRRSLRDCGI